MDHSCQNLSFVFLIKAILAGVKCYQTVVITYVICLLEISVFFQEMTFGSSAFVFLLLSKVLYIFRVLTPYQTYSLQISSPSIACLR
jgi:hypothetical protein